MGQSDGVGGGEKWQRHGAMRVHREGWEYGLEEERAGEKLYFLVGALWLAVDGKRDGGCNGAWGCAGRLTIILFSNV